jgi:hypothetical protein
MIRRIVGLLLLTATMCGLGLAQQAVMERTPPTRAQVLQLMSAMGVQQAIDSTLENAQNKLKTAAHDSFLKKHPDADAATLKKLDEVFDSTPLFSFEAVSEALIPAYQKNLDAADAQAAIDFYSSAAGRRLLEKLPAILREANESGGKLVQQKLAAYSEELQRKLEAFSAEQNPAKSGDDKANPNTTKPADPTSK